MEKIIIWIQNFTHIVLKLIKLFFLLIWKQTDSYIKFDSNTLLSIVLKRHFFKALKFLSIYLLYVQYSFIKSNLCNHGSLKGQNQDLIFNFYNNILALFLSFKVYLHLLKSTCSI